jgi:ubiquinone/menaquinone biosynthesis C-methylase UbiE
MKFPDNEKFLNLLGQAGWADAHQIKLTGGVASIYTGIKPNMQ